MVEYTIVGDSKASHSRRCYINVLPLRPGVKASAEAVKTLSVPVKHVGVPSSVHAKRGGQVASMYKGYPGTLELLKGETDDDSWSVARASAGHGKCEVHNNVLSYTPPKGFSGTDTIRYMTTDGYGVETEEVLEVHVLKSAPRGWSCESGTQEMSWVDSGTPAESRVSVESSVDSTPEVTMYQGMAAKLTLSSDTGDESLFHIQNATGSHGKCALGRQAGQELTYTPNKDFIGTDVVTYQVKESGRNRSLIVHVMPLPHGMCPGGEQALAVQSPAQKLASHAAVAIGAAHLHGTARACLERGNAQEVTMYQNMAAKLALTSEDGDDGTVGMLARAPTH